MGAEWYPVRFTYAETLPFWMEHQARSFLQWGESLVFDLQRFNAHRLSTPIERQVALKSFVEMTQALSQHSEFKINPETGYPDNRPVTIGILDVVPAEWRINVFSSYLPEELGIHLSLWQSHLEALQQGYHRAYLLEWYLYAESANAYQFWLALQQVTADVSKHTTAWAKHLASTPLLDTIQALPDPTRYPLPKWEVWCDESFDGQFEDNERYQTLQDVIKNLHRVRTIWNRLVPLQHQLPTDMVPFTTRTAAQFLAQIQALEHEMNWLQGCVDAGYGLLFEA